ncbi:DEKNAAC104604 [Brettanomyces naardenensis]|uniref:DEKNAAC104604 n=1 Tax=Brettanomyces naardenensis TaxID=13370 RepID=A0A448YR88_BRENA|nr:DEKNAAC104604 [Brettanomyces naardenensis]
MGSVSKDDYYRLASDLEPERISAATSLIKGLSAADNKDDWKYAIDRLIKGLSSSRASARVGFSLCLGEILSILINDKDDYSVEQFLKDLNRKLHENSAHSNGKNVRALLFGRLFGYQSLINANVLQGHIDQILMVYDALIQIGLTKSWIREICFVTICKSLKTLKLDQNDEVIVELLRKLKKNHLLLSPEGLLVYLSIDPEKRQVLTQEAGIEDEGWKNGNPLAKGNLEMLVKVLTDSAASGSDDANGERKSRQMGSWTPTLHYVWTPLLQELASPYTGVPEKKHKKHKKSKRRDTSGPIALTEFWQPVVDNQFFKLSASPERKYWGFQILNQALTISSLTTDQVASLLSPNLIRSLINQSSKENRMLHSVAKNTLRALVSTSKEYEERRMPILKELLHASLNFDKLTKSKTVNDILDFCESKQSLSEVIEYLTSLEKESHEDIIKYQLFTLDSSLKLVRTKKETFGNNPELLKTVLNYLIEHSFLTKKADPTRFTERMSKLSAERLFSILSEAMSLEGETDWPNYVIERLKLFDPQLGDGVDAYDMRFDCEGELAELKSEAIRTLDKIKSEMKRTNPDDPRKEILKCFEILFSVSLIELYTGGSESASILSDLKVAFEKSSNGEGDEGDNVMQVLIDLMLLYINQRSTLMKKVAFTIWRNLVDRVDNEQLERLFEILLTKENKLGQETLFDVGDEEGSSDDSSTSDEEPETDMNASVSGEMMADEPNDDERKRKIEEVDRNTTSALSKALRISEAEDSGVEVSKGADADVEQDEDEEEGEVDSDMDSDEESMSDEEMMALDSTLSQIFKQRREAMQSIEGRSGNQRKIEAHDAREMMIFFKNRVLDLLEIFSDKRPTDALNLKILFTLLDLIALTMDKNVGMKAHKLIRKICKGKMKLESEDDAVDAIRHVQDAASHSKIQAHTSACSHVSLFLTKLLSQQFGDDGLDKAFDSYYLCFKKWAADGDDKITSAMFLDLINWTSSRRHDIKK